MNNITGPAPACLRAGGEQAMHAVAGGEGGSQENHLKGIVNDESVSSHFSFLKINDCEQALMEGVYPFIVML